MRTIQVEGKGKDARLVLGEAPEPDPRAGEMVIEVVATAVNRADLMQRRGVYPPPPGASDVIGLECAGHVAALGEGAEGFEVGERVMALLAGGGYAERVRVDCGSVLRVPDALDLTAAAAFPETFLTCHLNLFMIAGLERGQAALVHGGGSGIGTSAIQLLGRAGVTSIVTCGSEDKCRRALELGADVAINYRDGPFAPAALEATGGGGVDAVLDSIGAPYLAQHLACLATGGSLVFIGLMGGATAEIQLGPLLMKRLRLIGSTLRARPLRRRAVPRRRGSDPSSRAGFSLISPNSNVCFNHTFVGEISQEPYATGEESRVPGAEGTKGGVAPGTPGGESRALPAAAPGGSSATGEPLRESTSCNSSTGLMLRLGQIETQFVGPVVGDGRGIAALGAACAATGHRAARSKPQSLDILGQWAGRRLRSRPTRSSPAVVPGRGNHAR